MNNRESFIEMQMKRTDMILYGAERLDHQVAWPFYYKDMDKNAGSLHNKRKFNHGGSAYGKFTALYRLVPHRLR